MDIVEPEELKQASRVFSKGSKVSFYAVEAKLLSYEFEANRPAPAAQPPEQTPPVKDGRRAW